MLTSETILEVATGCVACELADGLAILDTASNRYFSLNAVGRFVWRQLASPVTANDIIIRVADEYGIDPSVCADDVRKLLDDLVAEKLICN